MHRKPTLFLALLIALTSAALVTPAFALTVDSKGFLEIRGLASRNLFDGSNGTNDDDAAHVDQRFRLWTEAAADENVKGVFALEFDGWWGDKEAGDIGSDGKGQLEVKHVYLDFNLPELKTSVKAGTQYFKLGNGYLAGDDASGLITTTKFGDSTSLNLFWVKAVEGGAGVTSDDVDIYAAKLNLKAGGFELAPYLGNTRFARNKDLYYAGVDVTGKIGDKGKLVATLIKNWGDRDLSNNDIDGTAAYLGYFQGLGAAEISLEGAWVGDDGRADGEFADASADTANWGLSNATEFLGGGRYDRRNNGFGGGAAATDASGVGDQYQLNQAYVKLGFGYKTSEKTKLSGYLAHVQEAAGGRNGNLVVLGQELGLYYDIALAKGLSYGLAGAYLFNDDFGPGYDGVWKLGNALTYKF